MNLEKQILISAVSIRQNLRHPQKNRQLVRLAYLSRLLIKVVHQLSTTYAPIKTRGTGQNKIDPAMKNPPPCFILFLNKYVVNSTQLGILLLISSNHMGPQQLSRFDCTVDLAAWVQIPNTQCMHLLNLIELYNGYTYICL